MANRRITVLNPTGYQEVLQSSDTLLVDSPSSFAASDFSANVTFTTADFSGNITINGTPSAGTDAATVAYADAAAAAVALTASAPIDITSQNITIDAATNSSVGAVRFATTAEVTGRSAVDAAVKPDQLSSILDDIVMDGNAPIVVTESTPNNYDISVNAGTASFSGVVRYANDVQAAAGTAENVVVNPKQVKAAIDAIPYATTGVNGLIQIATSQEVLDGVNSTTAVTPSALKQEVDTVGVTVNTPLTVSETDRVFDIDITYATDTAEGTMRFATGAELTDGTATNVAITPANLETRLGGLEIVDGTTTVKGLVRLATNSETASGTEADAAVTPVSMRYALDQTSYVLDGGTY
ncbi:hypothetical protein N8654_01970 [Synechococcus sp. AH-601-B19]|nr:hypothetical protein [Synechococcus sp. AH-601-B19]